MILLAALAILRSFSIADLVLLVAMVLAATGWLVAESDFKHRIVNALVELSSRTDLLFGMLAIMLVLLLLVQRRRPVCILPGTFVLQRTNM